MLREIRNAQQIKGEKPRRWFFSHEQDLLIWFGEDNIPVAFQLAYGKYRDEHAIRWKAQAGFQHYEVDTGTNGQELPLLYPNGPCDAAGVLKAFLQLSEEIPQDIRQFVAARLREHPEYREPDPVQRER
jgi:hypothetical protein